MPSGQTAGDLIESSLRLGGAIAPSETPTADEINDGLISLNDLLELMSINNLAVWGSIAVTFPTVANQAAYTVGPTGNWVTDRPVRVYNNPYSTYQGVDFPVELIGQSEYDLIGIKNQTGDIIERACFINDMPNGRFLMWPVPRSIFNFTFEADRVLTQIPLKTTAINYPPGYLVAMKYALCIMLMPDYGRAVSQEVKDTAQTAMAALKRANKVRKQASVDPFLLGESVVSWQRGY